jgi:hypothetical protein
MRNPEVLELCVGEQCAMYLPQAKKCALVMMGYQAMLEAQRMQAAVQTAAAGRT